MFNPVNAQPVGKIFLRECGFLIASVIKNMAHTPVLGAVLDYSAGAFERFLQAQQRKDAATQLLQQAEAAQLTVQKAESIAIELLQQDFPMLSFEKQQAVIDLVKITPAVIQQRQNTLKKLTTQQRTQMTTVSPQATLSQAAEVYLPLLPRRRPKFRVGDFVEKPDLRGNITQLYVLKEFIASGGFGDVWRAENQVLSLAIKFCLEDTQMTARKAEAKNLKLLQEKFPQHPHIASLLDFNLDSEPYWLAFEFISGGTLENQLYQGALSENQAFVFFETLVKTMTEVHRVGLYHRDLKPANLLLTPYGQLKIADFGIGWINKEIDLAKTLGTTTVFQQALFASGTPGFMSPEQQQGQKAQADDDVYALGVILYQMLTGKSGEMAKNWQKVLRSLNYGQYIALLENCLDERGARFATAGELLKALQTAPRPPGESQPPLTMNTMTMDANGMTMGEMSMPPSTTAPAVRQAAKANDDFTWQQCENKAQAFLKSEAFDQAEQAVNAYLTDPTLRHKLHEEQAHALALMIKQARVQKAETNRSKKEYEQTEGLKKEPQTVEIAQKTHQKFNVGLWGVVLVLFVGGFLSLTQQASVEEKNAQTNSTDTNVEAGFDEFNSNRMAAEQGNAAAQVNLGFMYENGRGVAKDSNEAIKYYRLAAKQDNTFAQDRLKALGKSW